MISLWDRDAPVVADPEGHRLEEARRYEVRLAAALPADELWLDERALRCAGAGVFELDVGAWVSLRPLTLRWVRAGQELLRVPVVVTPRRDKLSDAHWVALLEDLERRLPGVTVGATGGGQGAVGTVGVPAPLIAEALLPLVPALLVALGAVCADPRRRTELLWREEPLRRARRADRDAIRWVARRPEVAGALDPRRVAEVGGAEPWLLQQHTEVRDDHPVNRYAAWLLRRVVDTLRRTATALDLRARAAEDPDDRAWAESRARNVLAGADAVERALRRSFLFRVAPSPPTEAALLVLVDDPVYARLHHLGRRFVSPMFRLEEGLTAAARPTYDLYELWCLFEVQRQLAEALPRVTWRARGLRELLREEGTGAGAGFVGEGDGETWRLAFNPTFPSWFARGSSRRWSMSGERRPDLVVQREAGGEARWLCLDAKWRVSRQNLADAFTSVHVYRDSLRDEAAGGACVGAALLSPRRLAEADDWFSDAFRARFGCGVFELGPGAAATGALAAWVTGALRQAP